MSGGINTPLQTLARKKVGWQWTKQQEEAFDACRNALIEHAQLHTPRQEFLIRSNNSRFCGDCGR